VRAAHLAAVLLTLAAGCVYSTADLHYAITKIW
jgi:hypothetical protein